MTPVQAAIIRYLGDGFSFPPTTSAAQSTLSAKIKQIATIINKAKRLRARSGYYGKNLGTLFPEIYNFIPATYKVSNVTWDQAINLMSGVQAGLVGYSRNPTLIQSTTSQPTGPTAIQVASGVASVTLQPGTTLAQAAIVNNTTIAAIIANNPQLAPALTPSFKSLVESTLSPTPTVGVVTTPPVSVVTPSPNVLTQPVVCRMPVPVSNDKPGVVKVTSTATVVPNVQNLADIAASLSSYAIGGVSAAGGQTLTPAQLNQIQIGSQQGSNFPSAIIAQYNKQMEVPKTLTSAPIIETTGGGKVTERMLIKQF